MAAESKEDESLSHLKLLLPVLNYRNQGIFFLNAMWNDHENDAEFIWKCVQLANRFDKHGKKGSLMNRFAAHKFLESFKKPLAVKAMEIQLKKIDLTRDGKMSLLEYLMHKYKIDASVIMSRPQTTNKEVDTAEEALNLVNIEIEKVESKKQKLTAKVEKGGVLGKVAKNELDQMMTADDTPIHRAMITAQAALRKAQKEGKETISAGRVWFIQRRINEARRMSQERWKN